MEKSRKERSEEFLQGERVKINPGLPEFMSEAEAQLRSPEEALRRCLCAFFAAGIAIDVMNGESGKESAEFFRTMLSRFDIEGCLTADGERLFALSENGSQVSMEKANNMQWRMEMCMPIFWAYGICEDDLPFPSEMTDTTDMIKLINSCPDLGEIMKLVKPRPLGEILDNADVCYRMHWACVEARIHKRPELCGGLSEDVVYEQHKGFLWLLGDEAAETWDDISADT